MRALSGPVIVAVVLLASQVRAETISFGAGSAAFTIDFETITGAGNVADTTGSPSPAGAVPYEYQMDKYELDRATVMKANVAAHLAITFNDNFGVAPGQPATGVSWNEAARFVNWLNTSQGFVPAYKFSVQPNDNGYSPQANIELWSPGDPGFNPTNPFRNSLAAYALPTSDEWYKAAYYDPKGESYFDYPTGSDTPPVSVASGTAPRTAVFGENGGAGAADVRRAGGLSPNGIMGLGGNVYEWLETEFDLVNDLGSSDRIVRGGSAFSELDRLASSSEFANFEPQHDTAGLIGFRVVRLPAATPFLSGDFNADLHVDLADFGVLKSHFGGAGHLADGDANGDGKVDLTDFGILKDNFGKVGAEVPEPSSAALLLIGLLLLAGRPSAIRLAKTPT